MKSFIKKNKISLYHIKALVVVMMVFAVMSCEDFFLTEVENPDIPGGEARLVVYSYISPQDQQVRVHVHRSISYLQNNDVDDIYGRADVYMAKKGQDFVKFEYQPQRVSFVADAQLIDIQPGNHYLLRVESYDGETVEAECYVPHIDYTALEIDPPILGGFNMWGETEVHIDWRFTAAAGNQTKYYSMGAYNRMYEAIPPGNDTSYVGLNQLMLDRGQPYILDENGSSYSFRAKGSKYYYHENPSQSIDSFYVYLLQTDVNYYRFHKSVGNHHYYDDDNPFSEAVIVFSNIQGGLGVFAGYNRIDFPVPDINK